LFAYFAWFAVKIIFENDRPRTPTQSHRAAPRDLTMSRPPTIYVIAGCNGAGKTTFAKEFLPKEVKCLRFLNADEIARGLSPLKPSAGAVQAARLLLTQVEECLRRRENFALESTLSGKTYIRLFRRACQLGYEIELHYLWLSSPAQAVARVRWRVKQGGHHVPADDIRRRFKRSLVHLLEDYLPLATRWAVWDSRTLPAKRLAISSVDDLETVTQLIGL
jgi:predicted ABC-type ATPase